MHYVYILEMQPSGRRYYGVSKNPVARKSNHQHNLKSGLHPNKRMLKLWAELKQPKLDLLLSVGFERRIDALKAEHLCINADPDALNARKEFVVPKNLRGQVTIEKVTKVRYR